MNQGSNRVFGLFASLKSVFIAVNWKQWLPSRGNFVFVLLIAFGLIWAQSSGVFARAAAAPDSGFARPFPYQGRLADASGTPLTNTYPMIFRLYAAGTGSVPLWEENWNGPSSVRVSDGLFSVMLGSLTPIPDSVITQNSALWLGITVGTDDEMTPRIQLGSVPFSHQAQTVADGSITTMKIADGAVTRTKLDPSIIFVPDNSLTTIKIVDGAVTRAKLDPSIVFVPDNSVSTVKIQDSSITSAKIADGNITTADIAGNAVTRQKLGPDVRLVQIQSGSVNGSTSIPGWPLATSTPGNHAYHVQHVNFAQSFTTPPTIVVAISKLDDASETNTRVEVYVENVTNTGFDLVMHKWHITIVYEITASWIAYGYQ
jgi:hypothetical protein